MMQSQSFSFGKNIINDLNINAMLAILSTKTQSIGMTLINFLANIIIPSLLYLIY